MTESENDKALPAVPESRVSRIKRIIGALSDFEQDELSSAIQANRMREYQLRLSEPKNLIAFGMHTGVICGAFFGVFMGVFCGLAGLYAGGILSGLTAFFGTLLFGGGIFGLCMGLYMLLLMKITTSSMARNLIAGQSSLFQVRKVEIPVPLAEGIELSLTAVASKKGWRIESINREDGTVRAMTSATFRSPGEIVGVKVDALSEDTSCVSVYSRALFTALDFGKNKQNVTMLAKEIEEAGAVHSILKLH
jgi:hypothetical protein